MARRTRQTPEMTLADPHRWRSRVVRTEDVAPDQLLASPWNYRLHPQFQQDALAGAIREVGYTAPVLASLHSGRVLDGHLRVVLALRDEQPTIPVTWLDVTEQEEKYILATTDTVTALAATDRDLLAQLLQDVQSGESAVQQMLSELAQREGIPPPDCQPVGADEQGRLAHTRPLTCPACGHTWTS